MAARTTGFSDVCGCMDELKRRVRETPEAVETDPDAQLLPLVEDALFMIGRMRRRLAEYDAVREALHELVTAFDAVGPVPADSAVRGRAVIEAWVAAPTPVDDSALDLLHAAAEDVRSVASRQEHRLRQYKDATLKLLDLFEQARGGRPWLLDDDERGDLAKRLARQYQAWLPSDPAGRTLVEWMAGDRVEVADETLADGQPVVLFEDGGAIPMSQVRWDPDLENFHPAGTSPGKTGLSYRGRGRSGEVG